MRERERSQKNSYFLRKQIRREKPFKLYSTAIIRIQKAEGLLVVTEKLFHNVL